jgi:alcohol dehydrogenase
VLHSADVTPDDSVAVFGLGGVGLAALIGAKFAGAKQIVAIDVVPEKLELAKALGATDAVKAGEGVVDDVRDLTSGGADKVIETVGSAVVLAQAYGATRRGGTTVTVGLPHPE